MSLRKLLGNLLLFVVLQFGALSGAHMTQEDIEKLTNLMHRTKVVKVVKQEDP